MGDVVQPKPGKREINQEPGMLAGAGAGAGFWFMAAGGGLLWAGMESSLCEQAVVTMEAAASAVSTVRIWMVFIE
jgi:hypothetical protein